SALLPVIRSCHGYHSERVEKCAPVARHQGSQVCTLTRLEEDTAKRESEREGNKRQRVEAVDPGVTLWPASSPT
ncbi:hypothetical protein J4Q44_G00328450, partial [Coregonus suidteri]